MRNLKKEGVEIEKGVTGQGSGVISNLVMQKNGVIRVRPVPYKKKKE